MVAEWEAFRAKERIGADPLPPTDEQVAKSAKAILGHAKNIERIVAPKK